MPSHAAAPIPRASTRTAAMGRTGAQMSRIEVPVPSKPRPYRPGDGPRLAPLTIIPTNDSDAFILDKCVLPDTTINGELRLQMYYVVGWPDQPAARVTVLATKIFDYVSARALEDFEYKSLLEADKEREEEARTEKRKAEVAEEKMANKKTAANNATSVPIAPSTPTRHKKKRSRLSKAELQTRHLSKQASFGGSSNIEIALPLARTSGPSLSTPQKKRKRSAIESATDVDSGDVDPDEAIYRQLYGEEDGDDGTDAIGVGQAGEEEEEDVEENDISRRGLPNAASSNSRITSREKTSWSSRNSTLPERAGGNSGPRSTAVLKPSGPSKLASKPAPSDDKHLTPPVPSPRQTPPSARGESVPARPPTSQATLYHYGFTPAGRSSSNWPSSLPPPVATESLLDREKSSSAKQESRPKKKKAQKPKARELARPEGGEDEREDEEMDEEVWVVKRLEGDKVIMTEDGLTERYFKVRWEGDWPPDQNPTWEPEGNIPPALVKLYLKKAAKRSQATPGGGRNRGSHKKSQHAVPPPLLRRKYSSVAEAFAGDDELVDELQEGHSYGTVRKLKRSSANGPGGGSGAADYNDEWEEAGDEEEERFVVSAEERSSHGPLMQREDLRAVLERDLASSFSLRKHLGPAPR
ncbi:hypothetical protein GGS23DRAFT_586646 [Durotheca rogersii]|uniref:uncharacterized protein n=1 Tax=Durotheca rogersii TaxID=419775 RepID=UPI00221E6A55|nr:uncharacterized protein GGS23DRAFT_586646 [Durotheca rogersii]KAI5858260.1 hypothetical protein GGS23DRAFT_586646 [Durotheca rogersii]